MRKALVTGSFDPPTYGHLDVIEEASRTYDRVTVGIFINPEKAYRYTVEERSEMLRAMCAHLPNVGVTASEGYVADMAREGGFDAIVRGVRNPDDLAYETQMADYNLTHSGVPTVFLTPDPAHTHISSSLVREGLAAGSDLSDLVPPAVLKRL